MFNQKRQIFMEKLFLEIDRIGRDHHPLGMTDGPKRCGNQIGKTLPDPGTSLGQKKTFMVESFNHTPGKIGLFQPEFKTG